MEEELLREISKAYLVPFFSGAKLESDSVNSSSRDDRVVFSNAQTISFKISRHDKYRLSLTRPQPFAQARSNITSEIAVVQAFVDVVDSMSDALARPTLRHDLLSTFERRVVAKALSSDERREETILSAIDQMAQWSSRTYEGSAISASIAFRHKSQEDDAPTLQQISQYDFGAVVSNGMDTLLEFDFSGRFISHIALPVQGVVALGDVDAVRYCPLRQMPIAHWTAGDAQSRRVALCLNRGGEILVFRDGKLLFTRRSGRWRFLTHEPILTQMGTPQSTEIRRAVYETCLDASFARTGACIGIVNKSNNSRWTELVVNPDDHLSRQESVKAKTIARMITTKNFQDLDRRLRQELVAIDGATVISHEGRVLAVGAILRIPGGSASGGRLAAAKSLSKLGLGIKVSQDGKISGYRPGRDRPAFEVM